MTYYTDFLSLHSAGSVSVRLMTGVWVVLLLFSTNVRSLAQGSTRDDNQQWNDLQISVPVTEQIDFTIYSTYRIGRDVTHLVDRRIGAGFSFKVGKYLTFTPSYLNIVTRPFERIKGTENRMSLAATVRVPWGKFIFTDRNQFERRLRFPIKSTRYRNRLQVDYPFKVRKTALQFFVSDEVFYDWTFDDWVRNRAAAGISRRFNKHFTADVYYMRQSDGRSRPGNLNIIGGTYRIRL